MVARKRTTRSKKKSEAANTDLLTRAARMVGTALGSISVKVRGNGGDSGPKASTAAPKRSRKAAAKKTARKTATKTVSRKRKMTRTRVKKA